MPGPTVSGKRDVKKLAIIAAVCGCFISSQAHAKTFVGVLWPMFGPLPAIGLVELVSEIKNGRTLSKT
jgi:hypothetical protein